MSHIMSESSESVINATKQPGAGAESISSDHPKLPPDVRNAYEGLMAELNVMLIAEEEVEAEAIACESAPGDAEEDLWLPL
jgi:hypothetical protein